MSTEQISSEVTADQGEENHDRFVNTFPRKEVHSREWRFFAHDRIVFSEA